MLTPQIETTPVGSSKAPATLATVLYEDLAAGLRARALMECVECSMDVPTQFKLELWRFDWVGERSLASVALSMARRSALMIVSASSSSPLPAATENWINAWIQSDKTSPMILLLPKEKCLDLAAHPLHQRLKQAAGEKGVDFFCECFDPPVSSADNCSFRRAGRGDELTMSATFGFGRVPLQATRAGANRVRAGGLLIQQAN